MRLSDCFKELERYCVASSLLQDIEATGATHDSRCVKPGYVFCAVRGEKSDGHAYIRASIQSGAVAVMCEQPLPEDIRNSVSWIQVRDGHKAMARVAQWASGHASDSMKLWGITGTNGKTTSAYLLRSILCAANRHTGMVGTIVYEIGNGISYTADRTTPTPFDLQKLFAEMCQAGTTDAVMEVSSHSIDQERFADSQFSGAIFTNLTQDHLDYHHTMENYYLCKRRMFADMMADGAPLVINSDDEYGARLASEMRAIGKNVIAFGARPGADAVMTIQHYVSDGILGQRVAIRLPDGKKLEATVRQPGEYNAYNLAGAMILAAAAGIDTEIICRTASDFAGAPGRLQYVGLPNGARAYVDYAHTDDAITKALGALRPFCSGKLVIVFGCGGDRDRTKRPKMATAASAADFVIVTSDNPRTESPDAIIRDILPGIPASCRYLVEPDRAAALLAAARMSAPEDVILVAGKGHEDYQEINGVKHHFSDVEVLSKIQEKDCE